jgi:hypothetical protein
MIKIIRIQKTNDAYLMTLGIGDQSTDFEIKTLTDLCSLIKTFKFNQQQVKDAMSRKENYEIF